MSVAPYSLMLMFDVDVDESSTVQFDVDELEKNF